MRLNRRQWLLALTALAAGPLRRGPLALLGCGPAEPVEPPSILRVPLTQIPDGGRVEQVHKLMPIEWRREGEMVTARSLFCSHQLCRVEWKDADRRYHCPCHGGVFAEDGTVVYGPPPRPLYDLTVTRDDGEVWIDTDEIYRLRAASRALEAPTE